MTCCEVTDGWRRADCDVRACRSWLFPIMVEAFPDALAEQLNPKRKPSTELRSRKEWVERTIGLPSDCSMLYGEIAAPPRAVPQGATATARVPPGEKHAPRADTCMLLQPIGKPRRCNGIRLTRGGGVLQ